jgi:hypothetical protein
MNVIFLILGVMGVGVGALTITNPFWRGAVIAASVVVGLIGFGLIANDWFTGKERAFSYLEADLSGPPNPSGEFPMRIVNDTSLLIPLLVWHVSPPGTNTGAAVYTDAYLKTYANLSGVWQLLAPHTSPVMYGRYFPANKYTVEFTSPQLGSWVEELEIIESESLVVEKIKVTGFGKTLLPEKTLTSQK